jgi:ABC-type amino acid transport substrate-binding protein
MKEEKKMERKSYLLLLTVSISLVLISAPLFAGLSGPSKGRQQLVDALDAAWVRVLDSGEYRKIINAHGASDVLVNIVDCLPNPDITPFPEKPVGLLKQILDSKKIRVGTMAAGPPGPETTANFFSPISADMLKAVLNEISTHYSTGPITITQVILPPPFNATAALNKGEIDIIDQLNALGGKSENLRRRTSRRFTCTLSGSRQVLHVKNEASYKNINDVLNDPDLKICAGPLSTQLAKAYFDAPGQSVTTKYVFDISLCLAQVLNGKADAMISPLPDEKNFPALIDTDGDRKPDKDPRPLIRPIDTNLVAGTPFWVAIDGECDCGK